MKFSDARKARYRRENVYSVYPSARIPAKKFCPE
jgi:hypothetical protein